MSNPITPTTGLKGKFTFKDPFAINNELTLQVTAVRTISDYIDVGRNLYVDLYTPFGLTSEDYLSDKSLNIPIVTFVSVQQKTIIVPASYILKLPSLGNDINREFKWYQAITSLGLLPANFDTLSIEEAIKTTISSYIGVEPKVMVTTAATLDNIDNTAAELAEATRLAAITYKSTMLKDKLDLENKLSEARDQIEMLLRVIDDLKSTP